MSYSPNNSRIQRFARAGQGYAFFSGVLNITLAAETDLILIRNPAASGKLLELYEQFFALPGESSSTTCIIKVYKNPTVTLNGTALTIGGLRNGQATAVQLANVSPVISARGIQVQEYNVTYQSLPPRHIDLIRFIEQGESILITGTPSASTTPVTMSQTHVETTP